MVDEAVENDKDVNGDEEDDENKADQGAEVVNVSPNL